MHLRTNYLTIMTAIRDQLKTGTDVVTLVTAIDVEKLRSSATYFERIGEEVGDAGIAAVCKDVLALFPSVRTW